MFYRVILLLLCFLTWASTTYAKPKTRPVEFVESIQYQNSEAYCALLKNNKWVFGTFVTRRSKTKFFPYKYARNLIKQKIKKAKEKGKKTKKLRQGLVSIRQLVKLEKQVCDALVNSISTNTPPITETQIPSPTQLASTATPPPPVSTPTPTPQPTNTTAQPPITGGASEITNLNQFVGMSVYAQDGRFLGIFSGDKFATDSIANEFGSYGSKFQTYSIFNEFGLYGSQFQTYSAFNKFTSTPPFIFNEQSQRAVAFLTINQFIGTHVNPCRLAIAIQRFSDVVSRCEDF